MKIPSLAVHRCPMLTNSRERTYRPFGTANPSSVNHEEPLRARLNEERTMTTLEASAGVGLAVSWGLALNTLLPFSADVPSLLNATSTFAAITGTYLALCMLILAARIPFIEGRVGQDSLIALHKKLGPWPIWLILIHVVTVVLSQALSLDKNPLGQLWTMITTEPWILAATASILIFISIGISSWHRVRNAIPRETWWTLHLYTYLAIALAFAHQVTSGGPFVSGFGKVWWTALYLLTASAMIIWRFATPLWCSLHHRFRVVAVVPETSDVVSIWLRGRTHRPLAVTPGQFLTVRFYREGLLWEGHSYSVSGVSPDGAIRLTVKALGDSSGLLQNLDVGAPAIVEGPYGVMTARRAHTHRAVLVAGGIGVTPIRAIAGELVGSTRIDVIIRIGQGGEIPLFAEFRQLESRGLIRLHVLRGPRTLWPITPDNLTRLVPDIASCDVFACGPESLLDAVRTSARELRIPEERVHIESFDL